MKMDSQLSLAVTQSKIRVRSKSPFFSVLLSYLKLEQLPDDHPLWPGTPTAMTNGEYLYISKSFFMRLKPGERDFVLAHEVGHVALNHTFRRGSRHPRKWNWACDFAINLMLRKAGFTLPVGKDGKVECLIDDKFDKMSADEIYALLPPIIEIDVLIGDGDVMDGSGEEGKMAPIWRDARAQARIAEKMFGKGQGDGSNGSTLDFEEEFSQEDWRSILWRELSWDSSQFVEWDRRLIGEECYVEGIEPDEEIQNVAICGDTSGSMVNILGKLVGEIKAIARINSKMKIDVYWADAECWGPFPIDALDQPRGGGGTDFRPFFEKVKENGKYKRAIYFTDLYGTFPAEPPEGCRTLWVTCAGSPREVPFGEIARVLDY